MSPSPPASAPGGLRAGALGALYRHLIRPGLFRLDGGDAEAVHHRTLRALERLGRHAAGRRALALAFPTVPDPVTVAGIEFPNRVGLAAGVDKDGIAVPAWGALGFGHVELGTVTARAQPGNPRPRLFRLPHSRAVINRMGFNNSGVEALAARLRGLRSGHPAPVPPGLVVGVSIGKTKAVPAEGALADYLLSVAAVDGLADYLAVNVSSPNTPGLRALQDAGPLRELLTAVVVRSSAPVFVKLAPDLTDDAIDEAVQVATAAGAAGIIATNTTLARDRLDPRDERVAGEAGGLSGAPLTARSRDVVARIAAGSTLPVIGVGGVMTPADAQRLLDAGASLVQVYTGFIYSGPALVSGIAALRPPADSDAVGSQ